MLMCLILLMIALPSAGTRRDAPGVAPALVDQLVLGHEELHIVVEDTADGLGPGSSGGHGGGGAAARVVRVQIIRLLRR